MYRLPDELLLRIFSLLAKETQDLIQLENVCRRFHRIAQDSSLWYTLFQNKYPAWGRNIALTSRSHPLIDWKDFVKHIAQQNRRAKSFTLEFVPDETSVEHARAAARQRQVPQKRKLTTRDRSSPEPQQDVNAHRKRPLLPSPPTSLPLASSSSAASHLPTAHAAAAGSIPSSPPSTSTPGIPSIPSIRVPMEGLDPPLRPLMEDALLHPARILQDAARSVQHHYPPPFRIQDPLVVDIDRVTKTGIVATGKHRREEPSSIHGVGGHRSEHKILFWEYPSWRLIREFDLSFAPADTSCQITGIQTIRMPLSANGNNGTCKVRLFSLAVGQPLLLHNHLDDMDNDDHVDLWETVLIYRLFDNGATQCVAHVDMDGQLLGRDVFFFSEASWCRSSDGSDDDYARQAPPQENVSEWMKIVAPEHSHFDPVHTVFMLATGPDFPRVSGCGRLVKFDVRGSRNILDPAAEPVMWDINTRRFRPLFPATSVGGSTRFGYVMRSSSAAAGAFHHRRHTATTAVPSIPRLDIPPAAVIARIPMGRKISCMIHFRHPPQLNHLICTGSYVSNQLTLFDWRFGIKVGVLPWKSQSQEDDHVEPPHQPHVGADGQRQQHEPPPQQNNLQPPPGLQDFAFGDMLVHQDMVMMNADDDDMEDMEEEDQSVVQPWGLSATMVLPSHWSHEEYPAACEDFARRGLRLIAVGDNRNDKLEIKVWDISYLLRTDWRPLDDDADDGENDSHSNSNTIDEDHSRRFFWWKRGTRRLKRLALRMTQEPEPVLLLRRTGVQRLAQLNDDRQHQNARTIQLPYMPANDTDPMIIAHTFDKADAIDMPVRYTAYNVLRTSLFLLTEEGKITVVDIESGGLIGSVDNVAATPGFFGPEQQVRGIDVNVVGNDEIVVTSRQGLLRGTMI